jgi:NADPH:quinone reductase-like Zn-dependent oxidoreductase
MRYLHIAKVHTRQWDIEAQLMRPSQSQERSPIMRIVVQESVGGPEVLKLVERASPQPGPGEVLVRVKAAAINPVDLAVRSGAYPLLGEPPFTVGWDISGTVAALGQGVTGVAIGDEVFGMLRFPKEAAAYAEEVAAPADEIAPKPGALSHEQAAALPLAGLTVWQGLVRGPGLAAGQRALIHGAGGGVGHLAVQIAKAWGATVLATASTGKLDFVRSLGADEVIDYRKADFLAAARDVDVAFETVGGDHTAETVKAVRRGGVLVSLLGVNDAATAAARDKDVRVERISVRPDRDGLIELARLVDSGRLKVHVEKAFPLDHAAAAHAFQAGKPLGKVVLTM